jgi:hypothetical protein
MKIPSYLLTGLLGLGLVVANSGFSATLPDAKNAPQMVVTLLPGAGGARPDNLAPGELAVTLGKSPAQVVRLERLTGDLADMQLFDFMDDSTRSASAGVHFKELKEFFQALPPTTQLGLGYMRNGTFALAQEFTTDHEKAAEALRLPMSIPGINGSPYFALSDLVKRWPSKQATGRRAVLMLTDGVDPYWGSSTIDDPYLDEAVHAALKQGVTIYSIYLSGSGAYGRNGWVTSFAQSRLIMASDDTGGNAYFEVFRDPVDIAPFLADLRDRFDHQYQVVLGTPGQKGFLDAKTRTESKGLKIIAPKLVYVQ